MRFDDPQSPIPNPAHSMTDRLIAASADRETSDRASIRPQRLDEYLGQETVREQMAIYSRLRGVAWVRSIMC